MMTPTDWRERVLNLPLWAVATTVALSGALLGALLWVAVTEVPLGVLGQVEVSGRGGVLLIPLMTLLSFIKWLFDTLVLWTAARITGRIAGDPFQVGWLEGYRYMLPITMLMVLNSTLSLLISALTGLWMMLLVAWVVDLFILRAFLEMDWYELVLLNAVLGFFSCATGGLL
ncbi:MAG: hypothetical protein RMM06_01315 [Armatimonadota bacterium]|nr:hypothetical protein [bacterium]MCS7310337.1 hypothetical protein [Armatimonadota bacterium]MDW8105144.1 hypothetical protein [Armatimonadota bacterium]MDW8289335.1 hypothetical protein [Armatimonadota bacterium]